MRKFFLIILLILISLTNTYALVKDDSIIKQLENNSIKELNIDFKLKSFSSCENLENVMEKYIIDYWNKNKKQYYPNYYNKNYGLFDDNIDSSIIEKESIQNTSISQEDDISLGKLNDFSKTNIQVDGVMESDIIKTDGNFIYYYNEKDHYIYIVKVGTLKLIKKIQIPNNFISPVLYISKNRLVILASGYSEGDYYKKGYFINRNSKNYTIIYDTTDMNNLVLSKLYISDGNLKKSRLIDDNLYIISTSNFEIPYYNYSTVEDINIKSDNLIPKSIELSKTNSKNKQNIQLKSKKSDYNLKSGNIAKCNEIEYVLPDEQTLNKYDFTPSYNIISVINIKDFDQEIKKKVIVGNNSEIFMSTNNLYLTSSIYSNFDYSCKGWGYCIMPRYSRGQNTLIHQINIDGNNLKYNNSIIVPGKPLNQYSMDQNNNQFRIITQTNYPNTSTNLFILNTNKLELIGKLTGIEPNEQFKSSRFIGDKLFLVTFEQIDPLFVIDLTNSQKPKILGELKIPGYSTYLHPYDDNHLIGIGYNTKENKWGGVINDGIKIDLYEINYNKKCSDSNLSSQENKMCESKENKGIIIKQLYSETLGEYGSSSEALNNPRMFMWKASDKKLFLPALLYKNSLENDYEKTDLFQGLITLSIDKNTGIKKDFVISHIDNTLLEKQRQEECSKYNNNSKEEKCYKLIGGGEYCEKIDYNYVPKYCYEQSKIGEYLAQKSWNYQNYYIKRALWVGNNGFAISNNKISEFNIDNGKNINYLELK